MQIHTKHDPLARTNHSSFSYAKTVEEREGKRARYHWDFPEDELEAYQRQQRRELERQERKGKSAAEFFVRYADIRDGEETRGVVENAKALEDSNETHILSGVRGADNAQDIDDMPYGISMASLMGFQTKGGEALTANVIHLLLEKHDLLTLDAPGAAALLRDLADCEILSPGAAGAVLDILGDNQEVVHLPTAIADAIAAYTDTYNSMLRVQPGDEAPQLTLLHGDLFTLESLKNYISALQNAQSVLEKLYAQL